MENGLLGPTWVNMADLSCSKKAGLDGSWSVLICLMTSHVCSQFCTRPLQRFWTKCAQSKKTSTTGFISWQIEDSRQMQRMRESFDWGLNYIADRAMELSHDLYKVLQFEDLSGNRVGMSILQICRIIMLRTFWLIRCRICKIAQVVGCFGDFRMSRTID